ncbi:uncharacterized protein SCHCODRAFT_02752494 [Schizophyllum commune H4-8]|uniref:uncharacterized protein n=1 Tax=Schizophyllum commune (strain H4-8 / FGSC 9210) TaxID=578458 RepID=UPI00215F4531|nr:uncharacterized protein SCHCODRAFT_02752494 [Schizophyllum commune H4-8]KAI5886935.1 hypothetical protein SCHCODRAFT_02752494 [Schizophyllum commune H4-8]
MGRKKRVARGASSDAPPTRTLRPRSALTGRVPTLKERAAYRAAQEQERVQRLPPPPPSIRSASFSASRSSPAPSLADSEISEYLPPPSTPSWRPRRPPSIGWLSPQRRADPDSRPCAEALRLVSLSGDRCPFTGMERCDYTVHISHGVDRAAKPADLRDIERSYGLGPGEYFVNSRLNYVYLSIDIHAPWDGYPGKDHPSKVIIIPVMSDLQKMYTALTDKVVSDWPWGTVEPHKNAEGFIHYEEVFPFTETGYYYRIVPLNTWGKAGIQRITERRDGTIQQTLIRPPFTTNSGKPRMPLKRLHVNPYNMVWKTNKILKDQDNSVVPEYALPEVNLIRKIGAIMTGLVDPDAADFVP